MLGSDSSTICSRAYKSPDDQLTRFLCEGGDAIYDFLGTDAWDFATISACAAEVAELRAAKTRDGLAEFK